MLTFQRHLFANALRLLLTIVGGLSLVALLFEGLTEMDLVIHNRQSFLTYVWVSVLATPQMVSMLLPIAMFVAVVFALNTSHRDNEVVVVQASGASNWFVASPVLRLTVIAAILHLFLNLWVQPTTFHAMRSLLAAPPSDVTGAVVREGQFLRRPNGLTTYARKVKDTQMSDLLIADARDERSIVTYIAKAGHVMRLETGPAIVMTNGHIETRTSDGKLQFLEFNRSTFDLAPFVPETKIPVLKESDRFLPSLFFPDLSQKYDRSQRKRLIAEGHARIAAPLLNIAMAMIAIYAVLGGEFARLGYTRRIAIGFVGAVALRVAAFVALLAGQGGPWLNILQYLVPLGVIAGISLRYFKGLTNGEFVAQWRGGLAMACSSAGRGASEIAAGIGEFPQLARDRGRLAIKGRSGRFNPSGRQIRMRRWISAD
jgi:lipopolysaccharide export system permease protein